MSKGLYYFAHPYSAYNKDGSRNSRGQEANFNLCCVRSALLILKGYNIYSPIAHSHPIQMGHPDLQDSIWYDLDNEVIDKTKWDGIIMSPDWDKSLGCIDEKERMENQGYTVLYYDDIMFGWK